MKKQTNAQKIKSLEKQIDILEKKIKKMNQSIDVMPLKYGQTVREFIEGQVERQVEHEIYKEVTKDLIKIKVYKAVEEMER